MIANARLYSVTPLVAALWRSLLAAVLAEGVRAEVMQRADIRQAYTGVV